MSKSKKKRLLCEGWVETGCEDNWQAVAEGNVSSGIMIPTVAYVRQGDKVHFFEGRDTEAGNSLCESADGLTIVESYDDLELEERALANGNVARLPKGGVWIVEGPAQRSDVENANKRIYGRKIWERLIADPNSYAQKAIKERGMLGHLEHPSDGRTDGKKGALIVIESKLLEDGTVWNKHELLDTPDGLILQEYTRKRVRWGISSRGRGNVDAKGSVEPDTFFLETWDAVMNPSTPGAYQTLADQPKGKGAKVHESADGLDGIAEQEVVSVDGRTMTVGDKQGDLLTLEADGRAYLLREHDGEFEMRHRDSDNGWHKIDSVSTVAESQGGNLDEDGGDVLMYFNANDVISRDPSAKGRQQFIDADVARDMEQIVDMVIDGPQGRKARAMIRKEIAKALKRDKQIMGHLKAKGFKLDEASADVPADLTADYTALRESDLSGVAGVGRIMDIMGRVDDLRGVDNEQVDAMWSWLNTQLRESVDLVMTEAVIDGASDDEYASSKSEPNTNAVITALRERVTLLSNEAVSLRAAREDALSEVAAITKDRDDAQERFAEVQEESAKVQKKLDLANDLLAEQVGSTVHPDVVVAIDAAVKKVPALAEARTMLEHADIAQIEALTESLGKAAPTTDPATPAKSGQRSTLPIGNVVSESVATQQPKKVNESKGARIAGAAIRQMNS